jgi:hypothetical protein
MKAGDIAASGRAFAKLLQRLPTRCFLFCIVNSVALYHDEQSNEAELLVEMLIELLRSPAMRESYVFKVLLTAATSFSRDAVRYHTWMRIPRFCMNRE